MKVKEKVFTLDSIEEVILPLINATKIEEKNTTDITSTEVVSG